MTKFQKIRLGLAIGVVLALVIATIPAYLKNLERDKNISNSEPVTSEMMKRIRQKDSQIGTYVFCAKLYQNTGERDKFSQISELIPKVKNLSDHAKSAISALSLMNTEAAYDICEKVIN